ncbi:hypothetical protein IE81DRAFT_254936 [Ceraceosorus guamensis]|uniref:HIG1 domain-containing protein n=1 Tax=Ceraceosorus guamensis TaxID=1522189 RepID=A0A316W4D7_9BASI|nr:hypothetical protein IE81DRAFT_254936 [Ceraceosorus guamensis]PWN44797.1 hypothetical protein IE81DRAFT_254936 [Ceraceosorus guamensis]
MKVVGTSLLFTLWLHLIYAAPVPLLQQSIDAVDPLLQRRSSPIEDDDADHASSNVARDAAPSYSSPSSSSALVPRDDGVLLEKRLGGLVRAASFGRKAATPTGVGTTQFSDDVARQSLSRFGNSGKGLKRAAAAALFTAAAAGTYIGLTNRDKKKKQKKLQKQNPQFQQQAKSLYGSEGGKKKKSSSMFGFRRRSLSSGDSPHSDSDEQLEKRLNAPIMRGAMTKLSTAGSKVGGAGTKVFNKTKTKMAWKRTAVATTLAGGAIGGGTYAAYHYAIEADKKQHARQKAAYDEQKAEYDELAKAARQTKRDLPEEHVDLIHRRSIGQDISDDGHSAAHLEKRLGGITRAISRWGTKSKSAYPELKETSLRASPSAGKWRAEGWKAKATGGVLGVGILGGIGYGTYRLEEAQRKAWKKDVKDLQKLHPAGRRRTLPDESVALIDDRSMHQDIPGPVNVANEPSARLERRIGGVTKTMMYLEKNRSASDISRQASLGTTSSFGKPSSLSTTSSLSKSSSLGKSSAAEKSRTGWKTKAAAVTLGLGLHGAAGYGIYKLVDAATSTGSAEPKKHQRRDVFQESLGFTTRSITEAVPVDVASDLTLEKRRLPSLFKFGKSTSIGGSSLAAADTRNVATSSKWRDRARYGLAIGGGVLTGVGLWRLNKAVIESKEKKKSKDKKKLKLRSLPPVAGAEELGAREIQQAIDADKVQK